MRKFLMSLLITMLIFIFGVGALITRSLSPYNQAEAETIELAKRRTDLVTADEFHWYNGSETYFTITGKDKNQENIIVIVQQDGGKIQVYLEDETISRQEALNLTYKEIEPDKIFSARIGIDEEEPVWEVSFRQENGQIGYIFYSLTSGEWIRTIKNI